MAKTAVITGGGSGVGRAIAMKLAKQGWQIALLGRRVEVLEETARLPDARGARVVPYRCDITDPAAVKEVAARILAEMSPVEVLVNSAGLNIPKRSLAVLSNENYRAMMQTNLDGAFYCAQAFLPHMRERRCGTIINIISDAGRTASSKAGPAYAMSKFGMAGLTQAINAEERANGIRATGIFPGDIDTAFLDQRPQPPDQVARTRMLQADDVADCAMLCIQLPARAIVEELLLLPAMSRLNN